MGWTKRSSELSLARFLTRNSKCADRRAEAVGHPITSAPALQKTTFSWMLIRDREHQLMPRPAPQSQSDSGYCEVTSDLMCRRAEHTSAFGIVVRRCDASFTEPARIHV